MKSASRSPFVTFSAVLILSIAAQAAGRYKVIHNFSGSDGSNPQSPLLNKGGKLYGVAGNGGAHGAGVVFQLTPSGNGWSETVLFSFPGGSGAGYPSGALVMDHAGNLYGTAAFGGAGFGIVFELTPSGDRWTEHVLHYFSGTDGGLPADGVIFDRAGNLYGTTVNGGVQNCPPEVVYCGVVFQLVRSGARWEEKVLYRFTGHSDGGYPGRLVFDDEGNLYGSTFLAGGGIYGVGVVFKLTPSNGSWTQTVIHTFTGIADGAYPGPLIFDRAGNLYGTTAGGGRSSSGTVFELSRSNGTWTESVLYSFQGGADGRTPASGVVFDASGNLYGTTYEGGNGNSGTVFKLTFANGSWTKSVVHEWLSGAGNPSGLVVDKAGRLYGPASTGGANHLGAVFKLVP